MADFNASTSSAEKPTLSTTTVMFSGDVDDPSEDACSICLEPFTSQDPATITSCKHDYHLHCILEWAKRSNECPICSQLLFMKDPSSQELLVSMKNERCSRSRYTITTSTILNLNEEHLGQNASYSDDPDFRGRIMRHLATAASRARYLHRADRQRPSGQAFMSSPEEMLVFDSSDGSSRPSRSLSVAPTSTDTSSNPCTGSEPTMKPRVRHWQAPSNITRRPNACKIFSFPESIKLKFSATSSRYKESLQGIKEKFVARSSFLKGLSKGVQREINAGIARIIERLDLIARRSTGQGCAARAANSFEGVHVRENVIIEAPAVENRNEVSGSSSNATSSDS